MIRVRAALSLLVAALPALAPSAAVAAKSVALPAIALPQYPVCEASAAIEAPCVEHRGATCVWIGDNELPDHLFEYEVTEKGRLWPSGHWQIPLDDQVGDIEALVKDGDSLLAVGSHGRNSGCEFKKKRARVARIAADGASAKLVAADKEWKDNLADCEKWIALGDGADDAAARALRASACSAIIDAETAAQKYVAEHPDEKKCPESPFNVEAAVSVKQSGSRRIWLGLRSPLVGGKAILLRLVKLPDGRSEKRIQFDGIAAIDLEGMGIRELTTADDKIWGIAGTPPDSDTASFLWSIDESKLENGATIAAVEKGAALPSRAEGLVVQPKEKRAIVIVDGGLDETAGKCDPQSEQLVVDVK